MPHAKLVVIDDLGLIALPREASLDVGQSVALRAKGVTDPTGASGEDVGTCLAVRTHNIAAGGEAGICVVGDSTAGLQLDAKYPAILLPIVADLPTWGIDEVAIDWQAVEITEGRTTVTTAEVPANISSGPAPYSLWQLHW